MHVHCGTKKLLNALIANQSTQLMPRRIRLWNMTRDRIISVVSQVKFYTLHIVVLCENELFDTQYLPFSKNVSIEIRITWKVLRDMTRVFSKTLYNVSHVSGYFDNVDLSGNNNCPDLRNVTLLNNSSIRNTKLPRFLDVLHIERPSYLTDRLQLPEVINKLHYKATTTQDEFHFPDQRIWIDTLEISGKTGVTIGENITVRRLIITDTSCFVNLKKCESLKYLEMTFKEFMPPSIQWPANIVFLELNIFIWNSAFEAFVKGAIIKCDCLVNLTITGVAMSAIFALTTWKHERQGKINLIVHDTTRERTTLACMI